eukprot:gene11053-14135_t
MAPLFEPGADEIPAIEMGQMAIEMGQTAFEQVKSEVSKIPTDNIETLHLPMLEKAISSSNQHRKTFIPIAILKFVLKWGPRFAVATFGGVKAWTRYLAATKPVALVIEKTAEVINHPA